jgi:hypothetical protein
VTVSFLKADRRRLIKQVFKKHNGDTRSPQVLGILDRGTDNPKIGDAANSIGLGVVCPHPQWAL